MSGARCKKPPEEPNLKKESEGQAPGSGGTGQSMSKSAKKRKSKMDKKKASQQVNLPLVGPEAEPHKAVVLGAEITDKKDKTQGTL